MALLRSIIGITLAILIAGFAILNAQDIAINWSPFHDPYSIPLYTVILGCLILGFFMGGTSVWLNHGKVRKSRRQQKKEIKTLQKELAKTKNASVNDNPPSEFFPALPAKTTKDVQKVKG